MSNDSGAPSYGPGPDGQSLGWMQVRGSDDGWYRPIVVEAPALDNATPWKITCRPITEGGQSYQEATIHVAPSFARARADSPEIASQVDQVAAILREIGLSCPWASFEIALDRSLPCSKPYRCSNMERDGGLVTLVGINPDFARELATDAQVDRDFIRGFFLDLQVVARRAIIMSYNQDDDVYQVRFLNEENPGYELTGHTVRMLDQAIKGLPISHSDTSELSAAPKWFLEGILGDANEFRHDRDAALAKARGIFGDSVVEEIGGFAKDDNLSSAALAYTRDHSDIHGYQAISFKRRLEYVFANHQLVHLIDRANTADLRVGVGAHTKGAVSIDNNFYVLDFRLASGSSDEVAASVNLLPSAKKGNFRPTVSVCVTLTPQALSLIINARNLSDPAVAEVLRMIDTDTKKLKFS